MKLLKSTVHGIFCVRALIKIRVIVSHQVALVGSIYQKKLKKKTYLSSPSVVRQRLHLIPQKWIRSSVPSLKVLIFRCQIYIVLFISFVFPGVELTNGSYQIPRLKLCPVQNSPCWDGNGFLCNCPLLKFIYEFQIKVRQQWWERCTGPTRSPATLPCPPPPDNSLNLSFILPVSKASKSP